MTKNERISIPIWWKILLFLISFILLALQLVILLVSIGVIFFTQYTYIWPYFFIEGFGLLLDLFLIRRKMPTNYKVTWCILVLISPILFGVLYLLNQFSKRLSAKSYFKHQIAVSYFDDKDYIEEARAFDPKISNMVELIRKSEPVTLYKNVELHYFKDAKEKHFDMLEEMKKAKSFIYLEYFVISPGKLMDSMYPILLEKGKAGVSIKIIYDDLGSKGPLRGKMIKKLTEIPNCELAGYQYIGLSINLLANYRDHRKICVIDNRVAYCGGDNLADEYIHEKERFGYWRDTCMKYTGTAARSFTRFFLSTWCRITKEEEPKNLPMPEFNLTEDGYVLPFCDGPGNLDTPAYDVFCSLISSATKYLYISTPYFVIDDAMIALLVRKIKSGVDVRILMPHIPDKKTAFYMGRLNYRDIYRAGGKIYEFTEGFNHAKNIIVDDIYAFSGTINMDYRSLFLHYECGAILMHSKEIEKMKKDFLDVTSRSILFDYDTWHKKKWYQRLIGYIFSLFAPMF